MCPPGAADAGDDNDDVWGDDNGPQEPNHELEHEWNVRREQFHNSGYREGLEAGKEETLQSGFNAGFAEGACTALEWGKLRGAIKTLQLFLNRSSELPLSSQQVQQLAQAVDIPLRTAMLQICTGLAHKPPTNVMFEDAALRHEVEQLIAKGAQEAPVAQHAAGNDLLLRLPQLKQQLHDVGVELPAAPVPPTQRL